MKGVAYLLHTRTPVLLMIRSTLTLHSRRYAKGSEVNLRWLAAFPTTSAANRAAVVRHVLTITELKVVVLVLERLFALWRARRTRSVILIKQAVVDVVLAGARFGSVAIHLRGR